MGRRIERRVGALLAAVVLVGGAACKTAPQEWRTDPVRVSETACGGWAIMEFRHRTAIEGELIATEPSRIFVRDGEWLISIPRSSIDSTTTIYADSWDGTIAAWTTVGALATISHGFLLILTFPTWIVTGVVSGVAEKETGRTHQRIPGPDRARFPQGLPPSFQSAVDQLKSDRISSVRVPRLAGGCPPGSGSQ